MQKKKKKPGIRSRFFLNSTNIIIIRGEKNQRQQSVVILGHTVQSSVILSEAQQLSTAIPADKGPGAAYISVGIYGLHFP